MPTEALENSINAWMGANRGTMLECLRTLVAIDTQNLAPEGNEAAGQLAVASMLRGLGCDVDVYEVQSVAGLLEHPRYWSERPCIGRPNVTAVLPGSGGGRSLLFSSHMDTVAVGPDPWTRSPWGEESEGRFYGLGAYDMKAGLAASILVVRALRDLGLQLRGDLLVESVVDEEGGGGNGTLAARLRYNADLAVVPEPTDLAVCPAHHGGMMLRVLFRGRPGIGFSPERPVDPSVAIARFIAVLTDWAQQRQRNIQVPPLYRENPWLPVLINQLQAGDVSLPWMGDRVPSHAWLCVWIGAFPGATQEETLDDLRAYYRGRQLEDSLLAGFEPEWQPVRWLDGSEIDAGHPGVTTFATAVEGATGEPPRVRGASLACDGHLFNLASPTPMLLLGPRGGGPHAPDEYIEIEDFLDLVEIFLRGALAWCGVAQQSERTPS